MYSEPATVVCSQFDTLPAVPRLDNKECAHTLPGPVRRFIPCSFAGLTALLLLAGCGLQKPTWQTYEERSEVSHTSHESPMPTQRAPPAPKPASVKWTVPEGWREEAGSGMRIAAFAIDRDGAKGTCTIISLGGAAGGLEANVRRWLGQLKVEAPPPNQFFAFLERQERIKTEGGYEGVLVDLTQIGDEAPDADSMLAALFTVDGSTLFVKLAAPRALLVKEREAFAKLCRSLRSS